jgi:hypothetical protein
MAFAKQAAMMSTVLAYFVTTNNTEAIFLVMCDPSMNET